MSDKVHYRVEERVALLVIDNPPVNALSRPVRAGLAEGLSRALGDDGIEAIVVLAAGRTFPAGADLAEFGRPPEAPRLPNLLAAIEAAPKPVVAAIHGSALGGGLELAVACHYRLASEDARLGLPEVTLGLVPGAGGTQRVPRLTGAPFALDLMLKGRPVSADEAAEAGLVDGVVEGDLESAAVAFAQSLKEEDLGPRPTAQASSATVIGDTYTIVSSASSTSRALALSRSGSRTAQRTAQVSSSTSISPDRGLPASAIDRWGSTAR